MKKLLPAVCLLCLAITGCEPQTSQQQVSHPQSSADIVIKLGFSGLAGNSDEVPSIVLDESMQGRTLELNILSPTDEQFTITFCGDKFNRKIWRLAPKLNSCEAFEKIMPIGERYTHQRSAPEIAIYTNSYTVVRRLFVPEKNDFSKRLSECWARGLGCGVVPVDKCETTFVFKKLAAATILIFNEVDVKTGAVNESKTLRVKVIVPDRIRTL